MIADLWANLDYAASVVLFLIGLYALVAKGNLIKKLMGLNIMETAVFFNRKTWKVFHKYSGKYTNTLFCWHSRFFRKYLYPLHTAAR